SANGSIGLQIADANSTGNVVQGNLIGTDASGTRALGNVQIGVLINFDARSNTIGGTAAGAGNVISANPIDGVDTGGAHPTGNIVQGNFIGTDATASLDLGNQRLGLLLSGGASSSLIGGTGGGNVIAFNRQPGVAVVDAATAGNAIQANSIYSN